MFSFKSLIFNDEIVKKAQSIAQTGAWEYDPGSQSMYWSQEVFRIFDQNPQTADNSPAKIAEQVAGKLNKADKSKLDSLFRACVQKGTPFELELSITLNNEYQKHLLVCGKAMGDSRIVGYIRDISDTKKALTEKNRMLEQLHQVHKLEAVSRLAGSMAHDLNNILTVVMGYTEELLDAIDSDDPLRHDLKEIEHACQRANNLVKQLQSFSHKQAGVKKVLSLNNTINELQPLLSRICGGKIEIDLQLEPKLGYLKADSSHLEQIITNITLNAREAMPDGGKLLLKTYNLKPPAQFFTDNPDIIRAQYVAMDISDSGVGMTEDVMEHIFEPFFSTKQQTEGTGLGLATVYGMVQQNGGYIRVSSLPGKGTTFTLLLPRSSGSPAEIASPKFFNPENEPAKHILVVEDDEAICDMICKILSKLNFQVSTANDGNEALIMIKSGGLKPDLVLSDVVMPGLNGIDLAALLPRLVPGIKIILMSGYSERVISQHGKRDPRIPLIQKPFSKSELESRIRQVLAEE